MNFVAVFAYIVAINVASFNFFDDTFLLNYINVLWMMLGFVWVYDLRYC